MNRNQLQHGQTEAVFRAFTLIELLVVVVIVAVLAALLLPALAGAKADTWRAQCQGNMRMLGTCFRLFEQDHNDMFPPATLAGGSVGVQMLGTDPVLEIVPIAGTAPTVATRPQYSPVFPGAR
jgi:prepilin-type N-terminal cleavage/methylation domain-containing protein